MHSFASGLSVFPLLVAALLPRDATPTTLIFFLPSAFVAVVTFPKCVFTPSQVLYVRLRFSSSTLSTCNSCHHYHRYHDLLHANLYAKWAFSRICKKKMKIQFCWVKMANAQQLKLPASALVPIRSINIPENVLHRRATATLMVSCTI